MDGHGCGLGPRSQSRTKIMILVEKSKAEVFFQNYQNSTLSVLKFLLTIQKQLLLSSLTFYFYKNFSLLSIFI